MRHSFKVLGDVANPVHLALPAQSLSQSVAQARSHWRFALLAFIAQLLALIYGVACYAQPSTTPNPSAANAAFDEGKRIANQVNSGIKAGISTTQGTAIVPYYSGTSPQGQMFGNGQGITSAAGMQRMAACATNPATGSAFNRQECEAVNFMARSPTIRPQFTVSRNDPLLTGSAATIASASSVVGSNTLGGTYSNCTTTNQTTPAEFNSQACHNYATADNNSCPITRDVQVQAAYNYRCEKSNAAQTNTFCTKNLEVTCQADANCHAGDFVSISVDGVMGNLTIGGPGNGNYDFGFGTPGNNYLPEGDYISTFAFEMVDAPKIKEFTLLSVTYDDYLWIKLNDRNVFVGPYGGAGFGECISGYTILNYDFESGTYDFTPVYGVDTFDGQCRPRELDTDQSVVLNLDLKPFLKSGLNTMWVKTVVGGVGDAYIKMRSRHECQQSCADRWSSGCVGLESRQ
jgi:hypothetical protein